MSDTDLEGTGTDELELQACSRFHQKGSVEVQQLLLLA